MEEKLNTHEQLNVLIAPLVDFMNKNGYHYMLIAGKDETCARYVQGEVKELVGMTEGLLIKNKQARTYIAECAKLLKKCRK